MPNLIASLIFLVTWTLSPAHAESKRKAKDDVKTKVAGGITFSPLGTVKEVSQAQARFSEPMVALGDARAPSPFQVDCSAPGSGRWLDPKLWVYDFKGNLPGGNRCVFTPLPGLRTLAGTPLPTGEPFRFDTGGPNVERTYPWTDSDSVDEEQVFLLVLDGPVDRASVAAKSYFAIEGVAERVPVDLLSPTQTEELAKDSVSVTGERVVALRAKRRFPNGARITLVLGKGVRSAAGVETHSDQVFSFAVRGPFRAEMSCSRDNPEAPCSPLGYVLIQFSAPVSLADAKQVTLVDGTGKQYRAKIDETSSPVDVVTFPGPFPERALMKVTIPPAVRDDAGRPLENAASFPLSFPMGRYPALAKFAAPFGILEAKDPVLPLTVRNVEADLRAERLRVEAGPGALVDPEAYEKNLEGRKYKLDSGQRSEFLKFLRRLETVEVGDSIFQPGASESLESGLLPGPQPLPKGVEPITVPKRKNPEAMEVVGIPLGKPGFYLVEITSPALGNQYLRTGRPMAVAAGALVTNLAVHFKRSESGNAIAWVTELDRGLPVAGALVEVRDCGNRVLWRGKTDGDGIARVFRLPETPADCGRGYVWSRYNSGYLVLATRGDDTAFVHTSWDDGIEPWRFRVTTGGGAFARTPAHTVFDRPLYRAGDTVHMKHFFRRLDRGALEFPKQTPKFLLLRHSATDEKVRLPLSFDASGIATTDWAIPKNAKLGTWTVAFASQKSDDFGLEVGEFRVEEFRVPLLRATLDGPKTAAVAATAITVDASLSYLSGGPAGNAEVKLRSVPQPASLRFGDYEGFVFANGSVDLDPNREKPKPEVRTVPLKLDGNGTARITVSGLPKDNAYYSVLTELEFADPNGEVQTVSRAFPVFPAAVLVGGRPDGWVQRQGDVRISAAVVTTEGKPVPGADVVVNAFRRIHFSHRKRLVGGFYAYENTTKVERLGEFCRGKTDARGKIACAGKAKDTGELVLELATKDEEGRPSYGVTEVYVTGEDGWFTAGDGDRIDVIPLEKRVEPGGTARAQVRMPFREATALVTLEREGVLDAWVRKLSGKDPIVDVPVGPRHSPNVFLSVLAVRGRVSGPSHGATALVDLGKPAFKMGIAEFSVGWKPHALKVSVKPERTVFRVREKAPVTVTVATEDGAPLPEGAEVAIAAIDEGLLELAPAESWNLLEKMMRPRPLGVSTATAISFVVGKRHFGLKAMPSGGGGGGSERTRELFGTLLYWNARVKVGPDGRAAVTIPLNDSLTGFRIAAMASAGADRFGTGQASIRTTQPLMILSGIPPVARQGDELEVAVTARNASDSPMITSIELKALGVTVGGAPQMVALAPGEAKRVTWPFSVPKTADSVRYEVSAIAPAQGGKASDRMVVTQRVLPAVPVRVYQSTISRLDDPLTIPVERPADAESGRGGVAVALQASLKEGGTSGVRRYMAQYPYHCLEQRVSRAVATRDKKHWAEILRDLPAYFAHDNLLRFFPEGDYGSVVLTAYVLAISQEAGWTLPKALLDRAQTALARYVEGNHVHGCDRFPEGPDRSIRRMYALEALSRYPEWKTFVARMLPTIEVDEPLWPTSALLDYWNVLRRTREQGITDPDAVRVFETLRGRLNLGGTALALSTEQSDAMPWLLVSGDLVAVRLLNDLVDAPAMAEDAGRLVRGTLARQKRGHWDITLANAWGTLALEKFGRRFENEKVTGSTRVSLLKEGQPMRWTGSGKGASKFERTFPWPEGRQELRVSHEGAGNPWLFVTALAAIPLKAPLEAGFQVKRSVEAVDQRTKGKWSVGDIAKVRLEVETDVDRSWVVVSDPIPTGATVLGGGLLRDARLAGASSPEATSEKGNEEVRAWLAFEERAFDGYRAYYEWVPRGKFIVEYRVRLNAAGKFGLPTTRVEAMYQPEAFSELPNASWEIAP